MTTSTIFANPSSEPARCAAHPTVETGLSCIQCERPICPRCVAQTPVGQLCKACYRGRQPAQYQLDTLQLGLGVLTAMVCSFLLSIAALSIIAPLPIYSIFLVVLIAAPATRFLTIAVDKASRTRRGKRFQLAVAVAIIVGALPVIALPLCFGWPPDALMLGLFVGIIANHSMRYLR